MIQEKHGKDELDLIELFGVIIKRRRSLIINSVGLFLLFSLFFYFSEKNKIEQKDAALDAKKNSKKYYIESEQDPFYFFYNYSIQNFAFTSAILANGASPSSFEGFVNSLTGTKKDVIYYELYPDGIRYFFNNMKDAESFINKINLTISDIVFFSDFRKKNGEMAYDKCLSYIYIVSSPASTYSLGVPNGCESLIRKTKEFIYKINFSVNLIKSLDEVAFLTATDSYLELTKNKSNTYKISALNKDVTLNTITTPSSTIETKKIFKYLVIFLVISLSAATIIVFIIEFLLNNKSKLSKYL